PCESKRAQSSRSSRVNDTSAGAPADEPNPEHIGLYQRFRSIFGDGASRSRDSRRRAAKAGSTSVPYGEGRDPRGIGEVVDNLTMKLGWNSPLAQSELLASWSELVGEETAARSIPTSIDEGVLTVACDSTAWATQLRRMRSELVTAITQK